jgi:hypothetical protein
MLSPHLAIKTKEGIFPEWLFMYKTTSSQVPILIYRSTTPRKFEYTWEIIGWKVKN